MAHHNTNKRILIGENTLDLTFITMFYNKRTCEMASENLEMIKTLNPEIEYTHIVLDNTLRVPKTPQGLRALKRTGGDHRNGIYNSKHNQVNDFKHAEELNEALDKIETRFAVFCDADFFVVYPNWLKEVTDYMIENNLIFFGSGFHPLRFKKWRYFPCAQFIVIDRHNQFYRQEKINFLPDHEKELSLTLWEGFRLFLKKIFPRYSRFRIGLSRVTGFRIKNYYSKTKAKWECLDAIYKPEIPLLELFLPDCLSFIPKYGYDSTSFADRGWKDDFYGNGYEEYTWHGVPFGYHLRQLKNDFGGNTKYYKRQLIKHGGNY